MDFLDIGGDFKPFNFREDNHQEISEYDELKIGDIIWAKRYKTEEEMLEIQKGHRTGPFVVVGKDEKGIQCLYGTGTPPKSAAFNYRTLELKDLSYALDKLSYVHVAIAYHITEDMFIKRLGNLTSSDKKALLKKVEIVSREGLYIDLDIKIPPLPLETGDIINSWKDPYLIIGETESKYECINMSEASNGTNFFIVLDGIRYYFDFDNPKTYSKLLEPRRNGFIDSQTLCNVLKMQQQRLSFLKRKHETSRGSLIRIEDALYYIYGENGNTWLTHSLANARSKNLCEVLIGNKSYHINFERTLEISKKEDGIEVIDSATVQEMDAIKLQKKSHQKNAKIKAKKTKLPELQSGSIIKHKNKTESTKQVVIIRSEGELVTMDYNEYLKGKYVLNKDFVRDVEHIGDIEDFDLAQVLADIQEMTDGYINKKRLKSMMKELSITNDAPPSAKVLEKK